MVRKIIWSNLALAQRKEIFNYWNNRNKSSIYSKKLNTLFNQSILAISLHPTIGKKTSYENIRVKVAANYLITYQVQEKKLVIVAIWDGRQNPLKFSKILL